MCVCFTCLAESSLSNRIHVCHSRGDECPIAFIVVWDNGENSPSTSGREKGDGVVFSRYGVWSAVEERNPHAVGQVKLCSWSTVKVRDGSPGSERERVQFRAVCM